MLHFCLDYVQIDSFDLYNQLMFRKSVANVQLCHHLLEKVIFKLILIN